MATTYLPYLTAKLREVKASEAAGVRDIKSNWRGSSFIMAATVSQLSTFLEAMAQLQAEKVIKTWLLVLDESDALQT